MKTTIILSAVFALAVSFISTSCAKDKVEPMPDIPLTDTVSFSEKILPMMLNNCATSGCHDAASASDGKILTNHAQISQYAEASRDAMSGATSPQMPLGGDPLADSLQNQFKAWILQGKLNN